MRGTPLKRVLSRFRYVLSTGTHHNGLWAMAKLIRIIDTSAITPLVERLIAHQPPWFDAGELLRAWFIYHLWDMHALLVGKQEEIRFAKTLSTEFLLGDDFALSRFYRNTRTDLSPVNNRCFHDRADLMVMPASVILIYNNSRYSKR